VPRGYHGEVRTHLAALAFAALGLGCTRTAELTHVSALPRDARQLAAARAAGFRTSLPAPVASIEVRPVIDRRGDESIGSGRDELLAVGYEVEPDGDVPEWLRSHLVSALVADGLAPPTGRAAQSSTPRGKLTVSVRRFRIDESTWARGVAVLDLSLAWSDGRVDAGRVNVVTTELMGDDDDADWSIAAGRLASWSAQHVANWARAALARRGNSQTKTAVAASN